MGTTNVDMFQSAGVPTLGVHPLPLANQYWFVSSLVGSNSFQGNSYTAPFGTLAFAASSTNNPGLAVGDCIVVMEGHTETVTAAGGITLNTAGLYVIGLGSAGYRPTFTFATPATTSLLVSAANTTIANIIGTGSVNTLTKPFDIQAAGCSVGSLTYGPVEWIDPSSSLQAQRVILTSAAADNLYVNLKVRGITSGGTAPVHVVQMIGVDGAIINLDCYGRASTAVVNFTDTASTNVEIYGYMYNASNSSASFAKDVVDTVGSSTWFASISDGWVGYDLSGGSGSALGPAQAATVIADLAVPTADATTNLLERDVIGNKTDAAVTAVGTTKSIEAYVKGLVTMNTVQSADSTANAFAGDVIGNKTDAAQVTVGTTRSLVGYMKGLMNSTERTIVKSDGALLTGADDLFTVTGGAIKIVSIVGRITTILGGVANGTLQATTTVPASTTAMSTTVAVDNLAAGAIITFVGPTGVLTKTTAGVVLMDYGSTTLTPTQYIVNAGTIQFLGSAAQSGVIEWTMDYLPMNPSVVVAAAA